MSLKNRFRLAVSILVLTVCLAPALRAAEITVFAAASLSESLKEIAADYQKSTGDTVVFNLAASSLLARQIEAGAPADIFFSADEAKMENLQTKDLIRKETRKSILSNTLVIVVGAEQGSTLISPSDLATDKVKRLALAEPSSVPAGVYAKEYLQRQKLWDAVDRKIVATENVRACLAAVESGNVDAGIVYQTDVAISKKVKVAYIVPHKEGPSISYPVAIVKESKNLEAAQKFLNYIESESASTVFRKFGFIVK